ncbi:MAG TPA: GWxTD domain-containing protein [Rhodothermales bacterium]|nr:GWxTD domain-containing protein [Rhodothermales bacterium]
MKQRYYKNRATWVCCLLLVVGLLGSLSGPVFAQSPVPEFEVDAVSMRINATSMQTRLDLYTRIPYSNLTFINTSGGFQASYEVTTEIYKLDDRNRRGALVTSEIWESTATVDAFYQTQAEVGYDNTTHAVRLMPGRYLLEFQLTDKNTEQSYVQELPVEVRNLSPSLALSDLLLLDDYDAETKTIFPHVSDHLSSGQSTFQMFYEIYADRAQNVQILREIVPLRKRPSAFIRKSRTLLGLKQEDEDAPVPAVYTDAESRNFQRGRHQIISQLPVTDIKVGDYLVRVRVEDENGRLLDESERIFSASWSGLTDHLSNLDEAIEQLHYIAKRKDLDRIKAADSYNERLKRFKEFWERRDPTPGTLRNEQMEEFYYRISAANQRFGGGVPGWQTDRGQVLVSFGEPDHIERHPYNYNTEPYEVWYYNRIQRKIIFVDKTGFGDYERLTPIWDDFNRIR